VLGTNDEGNRIYQIIFEYVSLLSQEERLGMADDIMRVLHEDKKTLLC
jgi:hypothetical protein